MPLIVGSAMDRRTSALCGRNVRVFLNFVDRVIDKDIATFESCVTVCIKDK